MKRVLLAFTALLAACGGTKDPCDGQTGICLRAEVSSDVEGVDQLSVSRAGGGSQLTPETAGDLHLPRTFAILLPPSAAGTTVTITVDGLHAGSTIASDTESATIGSTTAEVKFELHAGNADLGVLDLGDAGVPDGSTIPPGCGNHVVETGEACDDGNHDNGDACDPTCRHANTLARLAGDEAGGGYANTPDGAYARFGLLSGLASDGTWLYVPDRYTRTIRRVDPTTGATTVLVGEPGAEPSSLPTDMLGGAYTVDGPKATARFLGPLAVSYTSFASANVLYVVDADQPLPPNVTNVRCIDLDDPNLTTHTDVASSAIAGTVSAIHGIGTDGFDRVYTLDARGIDQWRLHSPACTGASSDSPFESLTQLQSVGASAMTCNGGVYSGTPGTLYYGCAGQIISAQQNVNATRLAGTGTPGCVDGGIGAGTIGYATNLWLDGTDIYFTDSVCNKLRKYSTSTFQISTIAGNGTSDYLESTNGDLKTAEFNGLDGLALIDHVPFVVEPSPGRIRRIGTDVTPMQTKLVAGERYRTNAPIYHALDSNSIFSVMDSMVSDGKYVYGVVGYEHQLVLVSLADGTAALRYTWSFVPTGANEIPFPLAMTRIGTTLYVAFDDGTLRSIQTNGSGDTPLLTQHGTPQLVALTTDGTSLYYLDATNVVGKMDVHGAMTPLAGTAGTQDVADGTGMAAHFATPTGLTWANGLLYTTDGTPPTDGGSPAPGTSVVRSIDMNGKVVTIAGTLDVRGTVDDVGLAAQFAGLVTLTTDGTSLFLVDAGLPAGVSGLLDGPTIRQLELATGRVTTMIGTRGQYTIMPGVGTGAYIHQPNAITYDATTNTLLLFDLSELVTIK